MDLEETIRYCESSIEKLEKFDNTQCPYYSKDAEYTEKYKVIKEYLDELKKYREMVDILKSSIQEYRIRTLSSMNTSNITRYLEEGKQVAISYVLSEIDSLFKEGEIDGK